MPASVLQGPDALEFQFKDIVLHGFCEGWEDEIPINLASYTYLKRDGGEQEPMGAGTKRFRFRCVYVGPDCGQQYQNLAASIQQEPRGPLVHPRLGRFNVACSGIRGTENVVTAIDVIEFTIEFLENQLDQGNGNPNQAGAQLRASQVTEALNSATEAVAKITNNRIANAVYAAATAAMVTFQDWAEQFRLAALDAAQTNSPDVALSKLLANVLQKRNLALAAVTATLPYTLQPEVSLTDARTSIYIAYAACLQLYQSVQDQKPAVVDFTVPATMSLNQVLVRLYGAQAQANKVNLKVLNRIPTPYAIPGGTVLRVTVPVPVV